ncbi:MAG TPA: 23S rRNA (guanosine(2251)-2'-O)-methyltransferase RlmB [Myxococcota bacterium]|nr:23S rRNA (guanosine(2251)-2'-O)-methyltransferase RlmB [Myxococcota bacterium]
MTGRPPRDYVYGIHPVLAALRAGRRRVHKILLVPRERVRLAEVEAAAAAAGVRVEEANPRGLDDLVGGGTVHQGVAAIVAPYGYVELDAVLARARERGEDPLVVALDCIEDPANLGGLARSAEAFGAHGAVIPKDRAAPVTPAAIKASAGALEHLPVAQVTNLRRALDALKEAGLWVAAGVAPGDAGARAPWEVDLTGPLCLVIGSEGKGVRRLVAEACDHHLCLPLAGSTASLNASAAGAALMSEVVRQRRTARR